MTNSKGIQNGSTINVNIKMVDAIKKIAFLKGMKIYILANQALSEYLAKPENVKALEEFEKINLKDF